MGSKTDWGASEYHNNVNQNKIATFRKEFASESVQ